MTFEKMLKKLEKRGRLDRINEEIITGKALDFLAANASMTAAAWAAVFTANCPSICLIIAIIHDRSALATDLLRCDSSTSYTAESPEELVKFVV